MLTVEERSERCGKSLSHSLKAWGQASKLYLCWDSSERDPDKVDRGVSPFNTAIIRKQLPNYDHYISSSEGEGLACQMGADVVLSHDADCAAYFHGQVSNAMRTLDTGILNYYTKYAESRNTEVEKLKVLDIVDHNAKVIPSRVGMMSYILQIDIPEYEGPLTVRIDDNLKGGYRLYVEPNMCRYENIKSLKLGCYGGFFGKHGIIRGDGYADLEGYSFQEILKVYPALTKEASTEFMAIATMLGTDYTGHIIASAKKLHDMQAFYSLTSIIKRTPEHVVMLELNTRKFTRTFTYTLQEKHGGSTNTTNATNGTGPAKVTASTPSKTANPKDSDDLFRLLTNCLLQS